VRSNATVISISHLSSLPSIPNVKCIAWNFDGSNFVSREDEKEDLKRFKFEKMEILFQMWKVILFNNFVLK
jgi:hypothetical protein